MTTPLTLAVNADELRRRRLMSAMTQHELARAAGVARVTVSRLEQGKPASPTSVRRIADALGVAVGVIATIVEVANV